MSQTLTSRSGDGIVTTFLDITLVLPDSGQSITVIGAIGVPGNALAVFTGSPLTAPTVPGSGYTGWMIESTPQGALTLKQSANAIPAVDAGQTLIWQDKVQSTDSSDLALGDPAAQTPDT